MRRLGMISALLVVAAAACGSGGSRNADVRAGAQPSTAAPSASSAPQTPWAQQTCDSSGRQAAGDKATLKAAYETTAAKLKQWQRSRNPDGPNAVNQFVASQPDDQRIAVCFFDDGDWNFPRGPSVGNVEQPSFNRIVVEATDSGAFVDLAGCHTGPNCRPGNGEVDVAPPTPS